MCKRCDQLLLELETANERAGHLADIALLDKPKDLWNDLNGLEGGVQ